MKCQTHKTYSYSIINIILTLFIGNVFIGRAIINIMFRKAFL